VDRRGEEIELVGGVEKRELSVVDYDPAVRTPALDVHVHIYQREDEAITRYLAFRDRLRSSADDRALYAATKRDLIAQGFDDMNAYADAKTDVIAAILTRSGM